MGFHKEYPKSFENLWELYPNGANKAGGFKSWKREGFGKYPGDNDLLMDHVKRRLIDCAAWHPNAQGQTFVPHLQTFINQRRWEDDYEKRVVEAATDATGFNEFWIAYPNKIGKPGALKEWSLLSPVERESATSDVIERAERCHAWIVDGGQYVPAPAKYLSEAYYEDSWQDQNAHMGATDGLEAL